eukprot:jgi/Chlat1/4814/Chrsp31S04862
MAVNPEMVAGGGGLPVPFSGEAFVLRRDGVNFLVDNLPGLGSGGKWSARGVLYLSNVRLVFAATGADARQNGAAIHAFDLPLSYIVREKFNQPIFGCNNITGVVEGGPPGSLDGVPHDFKLSFREGGVGTFLPLFYAMLASSRQQQSQQQQQQSQQQQQQQQQQYAPSAPPPPTSMVQDAVNNAFVDPSDPSVLYLSQPAETQGQSGLRQRNLPRAKGGS